MKDARRGKNGAEGRRRRRRRWCVCLCVLLAPVSPVLLRSAPADEAPTLAGPAQGTTYRVRFGQRLADGALAQLHAELETLLARIDGQMSTYRDDSDLARFNRSPSLEWFPVPADVVAVVGAALDVHRRSGGAFDVTVAPLVDLWGFGPGGRPGRVPAADEIARARRAVGSRLLEVRTAPPALRKRHAGVKLDVNGIAPGFTVDRIARCLERHHVTDYLIELGGEIRTRGRTADGRPWRVGIDRPSKRPRGIHLAIEPGDAAVSTSGDYRQYFDRDGKRYAHLIDPATGCPVTHAATSVSVVAPESMVAKPWATALMVLGPEEGKRVADEQDSPPTSWSGARRGPLRTCTAFRRSASPGCSSVAQGPAPLGRSRRLPGSAPRPLPRLRAINSRMTSCRRPFRLPLPSSSWAWPRARWYGGGDGGKGPHTNPTRQRDPASLARS